MKIVMQIVFILDNTIPITYAISATTTNLETGYTSEFYSVSFVGQLSSEIDHKIYQFSS